MRRLEGGCHAPIGALAWEENGHFYLKGIVLSTDGRHSVEHSWESSGSDPSILGERWASELLQSGAQEIMQEIRSQEQQNNPI